jgi:hypothetical protein
LESIRRITSAFPSSSKILRTLPTSTPAISTETSSSRPDAESKYTLTSYPLSILKPSLPSRMDMYPRIIIPITTKTPTFASTLKFDKKISLIP